MINPFIIRTQYNYFSVVTYIILCFSIGVSIASFLYYFKIAERHSEAIDNTSSYVLGVVNVILFLALLVKFGWVTYTVYNESRITEQNFKDHINTNDHTIFRFHLDSNNSFYGFFVWFMLLFTLIVLSLNIYYFNKVSKRPNQKTMSYTEANNMVIATSLVLIFVFINFVWNTAIMYYVYDNERIHDSNKVKHIPYKKQEMKIQIQREDDKRNMLDKIINNANK